MIMLIGVNSFALLCAGGTGGTPPLMFGGIPGRTFCFGQALGRRGIVGTGWKSIFVDILWIFCGYLWGRGGVGP